MASKLARRPVSVPMYFVRPHVKPGDYYLMINPVSGRRMWVYPRHMGERKYAVTSALGTDGDTESSGFNISEWMSWLQQRPQELVQEAQETRAELERAQRLMKIAIGASIVTSVLAITVFLTKD
jgi:hypothetical protein